MQNMPLWESIRGVFTPDCAPPIPQDPEVGTPKPQNPHRRRMEFGGGRMMFRRLYL